MRFAHILLRCLLLCGKFRRVYLALIRRPFITPHLFRQELLFLVKQSSLYLIRWPLKPKSMLHFHVLNGTVLTHRLYSHWCEMGETYVQWGNNFIFINWIELVNTRSLQSVVTFICGIWVLNKFLLGIIKCTRLLRRFSNEGYHVWICDWIDNQVTHEFCLLRVDLRS